MSRIGKLPVPVPAGVTCEITGSHVKVQGPMGVLERTFQPVIAIEYANGELQVSRPSDAKEHRALHGLTRALLANMVTGVSKGYERVLLIEGVGYRASVQGKNLNVQVGHSHPVSVEPPEGIQFATPAPQQIKVIGIDKELVGQVAADIRALRKPEPYKGKGIRYENERIRRKESKSTK